MMAASLIRVGFVLLLSALKSIEGCSIPTEELTDVMGTIYYQEGEDNSIGTWLTSYTNSVVCIVMASLVGNTNEQHYTKHNKETRVFYALGLIFLAVAHAFAGIYHAYYAGLSSNTIANMWASGVAAACTIMHVALWLMCSVSIKPCFSAQSLDTVYLAIAICGLGAATVSLAVNLSMAVLVLIAGVPWGSLLVCSSLYAANKKVNRKLGLAITRIVAGFFLALIGGGVQQTYASACETHCPTKCPFPVHMLNNNGVAHLLQMASIVLFTLGVDGVCEDIELQLEGAPLERSGCGYGTSAHDDVQPLLVSPVSATSSTSFTNGISVRAIDEQNAQSCRSSGMSEREFWAEYDAGEMDGIEADDDDWRIDDNDDCAL
jgi:hypothetical protein